MSKEVVEALRAGLRAGIGCFLLPVFPAIAAVSWAMDFDEHQLSFRETVKDEWLHYLDMFWR